MGLIKQGILGGFRKKTGTVVGAYWRRLDVIRALPRSSGKAPTQAQINQQFKFGLVTAFLSNISGLIDEGFKVPGSLLTPMNLAVSYHLKEAITGIEPDFELDLPKVRFSLGKLEMPMDIGVLAGPGCTLDFTWTHTEEDDRFIDGTDVLTVMVYNPLRQKFVKIKTTSPRSAMAYTAQLPANFVGDEVYVYVGFSSLKKKLLHTNSAYLGSAVLS